MAGEVTLTAVNGLFKKVYMQGGVEDIRPKNALLQRRIKFGKSEKLGESYNISVALRPPNGFTYAGPSGNVVALNQARNSVIKQATLTGSEIDLREQVAYKVLSSATERGDAAFAAATEEIVTGMQAASANRIEAAMLHGQRGYGTIESATDLGGGVAELVITQATWAPGMWWAFGEGATLDAFTGTTKNNASGVLVITDNGIDAANRKLTVTYTGTLSSEVAAGDVLWPQGANAGSSSFNEMAGLLQQASNTTTTSLGINAATYSNWKGNTTSAGGPISYSVVEDACAALRDRGAEGTLEVFVASKAYATLVSELGAIRVFDQSYSSEQLKQGTKSIEYFSPDIGGVRVTFHPFMKQGEALILPVEKCTRVGSSDITFKVAGMEGEEYFRFVDGYNAVELQNFTDQAVALKRPNHSCLITGITYTSA